MGAKFYRGSDKSKKIRKRVTQTRTWFKQFKWIAYHAHPTLVTGHPFKGGNNLSIGQLMHPDLKRFQINTPFLFAPPNPAKVMGAGALAGSCPSFSSFFAAYFGASTYQMADTRCGKMLENMKKCYEGSQSRSENPEATCAYYVDGFRRMACTQ